MGFRGHSTPGRHRACKEAFLRSKHLDPMRRGSQTRVKVPASTGMKS